MKTQLHSVDLQLDYIFYSPRQFINNRFVVLISILTSVILFTAQSTRLILIFYIFEIFILLAMRYLQTHQQHKRFIFKLAIIIMPALLSGCSLLSNNGAPPTPKIIYVTKEPEIIVITNTPDVTKTFFATENAKNQITITPIVKDESCDQLIQAESPEFTNIKCEYFSFRRSWAIKSDNDDDYSSRSNVKNGILTLDVEVDPAPPGYTGGYYGNITYPIITNFNTKQFYMSVVLNIPKSDYYSASGVAFGNRDHDYFYLIVPMNQNYNLIKYDNPSKRWVDLTGWKYSKEILKNEKNRLSILFSDGYATLFVNGVAIREEPLPSQVSKGYVGLSSYVPYGRSSNMEYDDLLLMYP